MLPLVMDAQEFGLPLDKIRIFLEADGLDGDPPGKGWQRCRKTNGACCRW